MAEAPKKGRTGPSRGHPVQEKQQRREATSGPPEARREDTDAREEDGWTQPESSAQKGAFPDAEEG